MMLKRSPANDLVSAMRRWAKRTFGRWHAHEHYNPTQGRFQMVGHKHIYVLDHWHDWLN